MNYLMEYSPPDATGAPPPAFEDSLNAKNESNIKTVENLSLHSGSLVSIWYDTDSSLPAIEFSINGQPVLKKASYHPMKDIAFEDWLIQHPDDDYDILIIEQGHQITEISNALNIWNTQWHTQCLVIYDAHGLVSITALADRLFELSKNGTTKELYPDF